MTYSNAVTPLLKLRKGRSLPPASEQHGAQQGISFQPLNKNFQVTPGDDHVLTWTQTSRSEFTIVGNEFCGIGRGRMTGKIIGVD